MLAWIRRGMGGASGAGANALLGVLDDLVNPGAGRVRDAKEREHDLSIPKPTPGDKLLNERKLVIRRPAGG
jgi:hypothetical protein